MSPLYLVRNVWCCYMCLSLPMLANLLPEGPLSFFMAVAEDVTEHDIHTTASVMQAVFYGPKEPTLLQMAQPKHVLFIVFLALNWASVQISSPTPLTPSSSPSSSLPDPKFSSSCLLAGATALASLCYLLCYQLCYLLCCCYGLYPHVDPPKRLLWPA